MIIGLTGSFGSGKTTVARMFKAQGAQVIDADEIARKLTFRGSLLYKKIISVFGRKILQKNGSLDRAALGNIVFADKNSLYKLNNIIHPEVIRVIKSRISRGRGKVVVLDAPLLIEAGLVALVDKLVVVNLRRDKQIARLTNKRFFSRQEIQKRIKAQMPLKDKIRLADFVIDNNGEITKTKKQVKQVWEEIAAA